MKPVKNHTILYVDDDSDDLQMLQEAVQLLDGTYHLVEATDGEKGLEKLDTMKKTGDLPCLIVLDINMPRMDGKRAFLHIRSDKALSGIPVVIFSTSDNQLDRLFFSGTDVAYMTKPIDFPHLVKIAARMLEYCRN